MIILAFDTAVTGCSVVCLDSETGASVLRSVMTERGQAEMLLPLIQEVVTEAGFQMTDIDRIAVTQGPGSFTGVRIGLAAARALGLALDCPVIGFSTLHILAKEADPAPSILALIDTKRNDFYGQIFDEAGVPCEPARIWTKEEADDFDGQVIWGGMPDMVLMAGFAAMGGVEEKGFCCEEAPQPIYLRNAEVSQPKNKEAGLLIDNTA
jgi:tRNA threonylcarbamoyl adenosine modification protein YeaZ